MIADPTLAPAPAEPTTPIKPSEALRLGRLIVPEFVGGLFDYDWDRVGHETIVGACALGAMAIGYGLVDPTHPMADYRVYEALVDRVGNEFTYTCPAGCDITHGDLEDTVMMLNDNHEWDTPRIADWLETVGL